MTHPKVEAPPDTRSALLQAALACFAEHGFDGTSMRMIAQRAQRPLSLLSHYFGHKEGLYREVFAWMLAAPWRKPSAPSMPPTGYVPRDRSEALRMLREQIHGIYMEVMSKSNSQDPLVEYSSALFLREMRSPRPSLHPLLVAHMAPRSETLRNCIHMLRTDLKEAEVIFLGSAIIGQVVGQGLMRGINQVVWKTAESARNDFQAAEMLVDLCLFGLLGEQQPRA